MMLSYKKNKLIKELEKENKILREEVNNLSDSKLKSAHIVSKINHLERFVGEMNRVCGFGYQILGFEKNRLDDLMCVVLDDANKSSRDGTLYLYYVDSCSPNHTRPRCYFERDSENNMRIIDIFSNESRGINSGNGSILLKFLDKIGKKNNIKRISGTLSNVDIEWFEKLEHFYHKNGYKVMFNSEKTEGHISKVLKYEK